MSWNDYLKKNRSCGTCQLISFFVRCILRCNTCFAFMTQSIKKVPCHSVYNLFQHILEYLLRCMLPKVTTAYWKSRQRQQSKHKNTIISEWLWLLLIYFATECLSVRLLSILYFFLTESDCPTDGMKFNVGQASCDTISVSFVDWNLLGCPPSAQ